MSARVSIVVRTKDRSEFLQRALSDISAQTFASHQVIVVNDGGDRRAVDRVVAGYAGEIVVVDAPLPGGRCAAANAGIASSVGEYLVLHDDDDLWEERFLERTVEWLDGHPDDAGVAVSTAIAYEERIGGRWVETARVPFWEGMTQVSLAEMLEVNRVVPIAVLYRRALHDEVGGYDERLGAVEDWEFLLRVLSIHSVGFIPGPPLALWMQRPAAVGTDANSMFALDRQHVDDDALVRDRALREWVGANGLGLPLYLAAMEKRLAAHLDESVERLRAQIRHEIDVHQPVASRLRRLRRRFGRGGGA